MGIKRVQALAQWWQPYGYLLLPAVLGVAAAVYRLIVHGGRSPDWPLGAATIIAALIIAAALEGGLFAARTRWPGSTARVLTNVLWYWPLFALIIAADRAADHKAFAGWEDVFVAGGIVTLVITIGNLAALRAEKVPPARTGERPMPPASPPRRVLHVPAHDRPPGPEGPADSI